MKGAVLWALLALAAGAAVEVDWTALERASLTAGVNETLSFLCSSGACFVAVRAAMGVLSVSLFFFFFLSVFALV